MSSAIFVVQGCTAAYSRHVIQADTCALSLWFYVHTVSGGFSHADGRHIPGFSGGLICKSAGRGNRNGEKKWENTLWQEREKIKNVKW